MVRKKVVKKGSSKSTYKVGKKQEGHKRRHHKIRRSLVEAKAAHNKEVAKAKVENLEQAAVLGVERSRSLVPIKVEEKVEIKKPVVEQPAPEPVVEKTLEDPKYTAIVQPDPLFGDDIKADVPAPKLVSTGKGIKLVFAIVSILILAFWIILISASIVTNVDRTVERNTTVTIIEPITMNYSRYTQATGAVANADTSLLGYLREEAVTDERAAADRVYYYVVDDFGNKLELIMGSLDKQAHDLKFKSGVTSEVTYNVTGTFKYDQFSAKKYTFDVDNIVRQDRPTHTVEIERIENVTIKGVGFRIEIAKGWNTLLGKEKNNSIAQ